MSTSHRRGITRVEALVVLGILLLLTGIVLPAVHKVRATAAQMNCQYNLKKLGLVPHGMHEIHGFVPSNPDTLGTRYGTLQDHMQPYLE